MFNIICKYIGCVLILIFITLTLSGCTTKRQTINDFAYVIAIGLDVGEINNIKLSLQISKTSNSGSENSGSNSSQSSDSVTTSLECSSLASGLSLFNSYLGREINLSHCKVIVFSEELASNGISDYLYTLINNIQIHAEANIIVCKSPVEDFLKNSKPILETFSAKYYDIVTSSSKYTGFTDSITFGEFFSYYTDTFQQPYAILGAVNSSNIATQETSNIDYNHIDVTNSDDTYIAGEIPASSDPSIDSLGLAVFHSDKLVGELNGIETISHMIVTNRLNRCIIRIPSPINIDKYIDVVIRLTSKPKIKVDLINGTPFATISIKLNARLLSMSEDSNDLSSENKKEIEHYINKYLEETIKNYLYKTSKNFNSDIVGFGKYVVNNFKTWDEWISYNWNHKYRYSFFSVDINSSLRSAFLLVDS